MTVGAGTIAGPTTQDNPTASSLEVNKNSNSTRATMQDSEDMDDNDNASQSDNNGNNNGDGDPPPGAETGTNSGGGAGEPTTSAAASATASITAARAPGSMSVTSDEVNYLIFRYLQECGFVHSAFTFAHESMLGRTGFRNADRTLPPGALLTFLQKGLQYVTLEERLVLGGENENDDVENDGVGVNVGVDSSASPPPPGGSVPQAVSLLSGFTVGALSRSNPVIQLHVPPASAAAALKARLEAEAKVAADQQRQQPLSMSSSVVGSRAGSGGNLNGAAAAVSSRQAPMTAAAAAAAAANMGVLSGAAALLDPTSSAAAASASAGASSASASANTLEADLLAATGRDLHNAVLARQALAAQAAAQAAAAMSQFQQQMLVQQQQQQQQHPQPPGVLPTHVMDHPLFHQQLQQQAELLALQQQQQAALQGARHHHQQQRSLAENEPPLANTNVTGADSAASSSSRKRKKVSKSKPGESAAFEQSSLILQNPAASRLPAANDTDEAGGSSRESDYEGHDESEMDVDGGEAASARQVAALPLHADLRGAEARPLVPTTTTGERRLVNGEYDRNGEPLVGSGSGVVAGKGATNQFDPHPRNGSNRSDDDGDGDGELPPQPERSGAQPQPPQEQEPPPLPEFDDSATAASPDEILQLHMHESEVFMCAWNPVFTRLIATGSGDASARIWEMNGATTKAGISTVKTLPHGTDPKDKKNKDVTTLEWSFDGQYLATGSYDGVARVWGRNGDLLRTLRRHTGPIFSLKWNRSGSSLLSGSYDTTAIVWDLSEAKDDQVVQQFTDHEAPALDVDWRDNKTFATCSTDKRVHIYMVGAQKPLKVYTGHTDEVNAVKWDPSGRFLASCSDDCTAKVWEVDDDRPGPLYDFTSHTQEIYTVKWSPTGMGSANPDMLSLLATASFDGTVRLWNVLDGSCFQLFDRHRDSVYSVSFSPSGKYLASGSLAGQLYIWHVERGEPVKSFKGTGDIFEVAWNKEETMVAACFSSHNVAIMDFDRWLTQ